MTGLREKFESELKALVKTGLAMSLAFEKAKTREVLGKYQAWYTRALATVRNLLPDRLEEIVWLYQPDRKREKEMSALSYGIADFLVGVRVQQLNALGIYEEVFKHETVVAAKLLQQVEILGSAVNRLDDILANIRGVLQAELFDTEIDASRELLRAGHLRASGAVAGVVLERHLSNVARSHSVTVRKKDSTISEWNQALKSAGLIDIPVWRYVQHLGDLRNVCCHDKKREPTAGEVQGLIDGTDKLLKTLA